ncbi:MAG: type sorting protein [Chthonomonadales bacterium]|nr:type sorting protein [Chthonomonadales bacterium]
MVSTCMSVQRLSLLQEVIRASLPGRSSPVPKGKTPMSRFSLLGIAVLVTAGSVFVLRPHAGMHPANATGSVTVGTNVQVSKQRAETPHLEVIIAADPRHPQRLLAASMTTPILKDPNSHDVLAYFSDDSGKTWTLTREQKGAHVGEMCADPSVAYASDGTAYLSNLCENPYEPTGGHLYICRSKDGGKTWEAPFVIAEKSDRPFLAIDRSTGKYRGRIYCIRNVEEALLDGVSQDGKTFETRRWSNPGGSFGMGTPVVTPDGTLMVPYPTRVADARTIMVKRSLDGGETLRPPVAIGTFPTDDDGLPSLAVDADSAAYRGRLYLVWPDVAQGTVRVMFACSLDRGTSWSKPRVISEQAEGQANAYESYLPTVAVNGAGVIGVSWYDAREIPADKHGWNLRFRASLDGGATWLPSVRVSETGSSFRKDENLEKIWAGDTAGLCADASGLFHPLWVDNRTGVVQVWTASISVQNRLPK